MPIHERTGIARASGRLCEVLGGTFFCGSGWGAQSHCGSPRSI